MGRSKNPNPTRLVPTIADNPATAGASSSSFGLQSSNLGVLESFRRDAEEACLHDRNDVLLLSRSTNRKRLRRFSRTAVDGGDNDDDLDEEDGFWSHTTSTAGRPASAAFADQTGCRYEGMDTEDDAVQPTSRKTNPSVILEEDDEISDERKLTKGNSIRRVKFNDDDEDERQDENDDDIDMILDNEKEDDDEKESKDDSTAASQRKKQRCGTATTTEASSSTSSTSSISMMSSSSLSSSQTLSSSTSTQNTEATTPTSSMLRTRSSSYSRFSSPVSRDATTNKRRRSSHTSALASPKKRTTTIPPTRKSKAPRKRKAATKENTVAEREAVPGEDEVRITRVATAKDVEPTADNDVWCITHRFSNLGKETLSRTDDFVLCRWTLPRTWLQQQAPATDGDHNDSDNAQSNVIAPDELGEEISEVITSAGMEKLLRHCLGLNRGLENRPHCSSESTSGDDDREDDREDDQEEGNANSDKLLRAMVDAQFLLVLTMEKKCSASTEATTTAKPSSVVVSLALRMNVVSDLCSAGALPQALSQGPPRPRHWFGRSTSPQASSYRLQQLLAALYPESVVGDVVRHHQEQKNKKHEATIAADEVYGVVDNMHLHDVLRPKDPPLRDIPGLVPTLRPYQELAVQWMLRRECALPQPASTTATAASSHAHSRPISNGDDFWKLGWVVVTKPSPNSFSDKTDGEMKCSSSSELELGSMIPLKEYATKKRQELHPNQVLFYSPFAGWIATSYGEAMQGTTGTLGDESSNLRAPICGGLLAESMGLGKTVEVLACVLAHPRRLSIPAQRRSLVSLPKDSTTSEHPESISHASMFAKGKESGDDGGDENEENVHGQVQEDADEAEYDEEYEVTSIRNGNARHGGDPDDRFRCHPLDDVPSTDDYVCFCGHLGSFPHQRRGEDDWCGRWVICENCRVPMHALCAGFGSQRELDQHVRSITCATHVTGQSHKVDICSSTRCMDCEGTSKKTPLLPSRATLIVAPQAILGQWEREIQRHTSVGNPDSDEVSSDANESADRSAAASARMTPKKPLKVLVYRGVKVCCSDPLSNACSDGRSTTTINNKNHSGTPQIHLLNPAVLADADVVLMSFDALREDLGHSNINPFVSTKSSLRYRKRYRVMPSPLLSVDWWRICLDEAQRVDSPTLASAQMALQLCAKHRWCVSGTPIRRGKLQDLYGLLAFLGYENLHGWFRWWFHPNFRGSLDRIRHVLHDICWRSTKASAAVRRQMGIPEQIEKKVQLRFSSIERHFYDRQLEETVLAAGAIVEKNDKKSLRAREAERMASQLHRLRAACCHPQVGSRGIGGGGSSSGAGQSRKKRKNGTDDANAGGVANGVLSMDQILDRLIDTTRTECVEAQRLSVMHTNAMACLSRIKVEAWQQGLLSRSEREQHKATRDVLWESGMMYLDALEVAEENGVPTAVVGEAVLTGCTGFRSASGPRECIRDGEATLEWSCQSDALLGNGDEDDVLSSPELWARIDFDGQAKKLTALHLRCSTVTNGDDNSEVYVPDTCVLQVSNASLGGLFVTVSEFQLDGAKRGEWQSFDGFVSNRSKAWRLICRTFGPLNSAKLPSQATAYVGLQVQLMEADIAADDLQRLHVFHNASLVFSSWKEEGGREKTNDKNDGNPENTEHSKSRRHRNILTGKQREVSERDLSAKLGWMSKQASRLEELYLETARVVHRESKRQLEKASAARRALEEEAKELDKEIRSSTKQKKKENATSKWWDDLLSWCHIYASPQQRHNLVECVRRDLIELPSNDQYIHFGHSSATFPEFHDVDGLRMGLQIRSQDLEDKRTGGGSNGQKDCLERVVSLSDHPSEGEILENTSCRKCRADWEQQGPVCRHCHLEDELTKLRDAALDGEMSCVLRSLSKWLRDAKQPQQQSSTSATPSAVAFLKAVANRATKAEEILVSQRKEIDAAKVAWKTHFNLLSDIDEMYQSKRSMRLCTGDENLMKLSEQEQKFIVAPLDIVTTYMEHEAKLATTLAALRRSRDTLRYLKNQSLERKHLRDRERKKQNVASASSLSSCTSATTASSASEEDAKNDDGNGEESVPSCLLCLSPLGAERAVLRCGHSFHFSPCIEKLLGHGGGSVRCPLRCPIITKKEDVLIASDKRKDDGTPTSRSDVEGSWGTKVDRLVADVMDVRDMGEKCIVFSQWDDMLVIVEQALVTNKVGYVRPKSGKKFGEDVQNFCRSKNKSCTALLLNVKNGAEGLTLVEATHVFMVEPVLNAGLDFQAISRIHRIGQVRNTYVHRYIVEDTIEVKIDKMRSSSRPANALDSSKNSIEQTAVVQAGGIDGGFSATELAQLLT